MFKKGQIGKLTILKPINLWIEKDGKLVEVRVLNPGDYEGQYNVGGGMWVTKMPEHIKYETPGNVGMIKGNRCIT